MARDFRKEDYRVVAVVGDGALSGGLAFEGLNQAGHLKRKLFLVLNDNDMSISTNVGAMSGYLNQIIKGQRYVSAKDLAKGVMDRIPIIGGKLHEFAHDMEQLLKHMIVPGTLFEELGFKYLGPYDGHDLDALIDIFEENKDYNGPILVHVITKKGKGDHHELEVGLVFMERCYRLLEDGGRLGIILPPAHVPPRQPSHTTSVRSPAGAGSR